MEHREIGVVDAMRLIITFVIAAALIPLGIAIIGIAFQMVKAFTLGIFNLINGTLPSPEDRKRAAKLARLNAGKKI